MKLNPLTSIALLASLLLAGPALAGGVKTYQVTGPVLEVTDTMVAVQKGKDRWELTKDATTKGAADLKVGQKATITYTMVAGEVESKAMPADAAKKGGKKDPAAAPAASPAKP